VIEHIEHTPLGSSRTDLLGEGASGRNKILVVDDSAVYRKLVEQSLSAERCVLLFAKNGREALDLSQNTNLLWSLRIGTCRTWKVRSYASVHVTISQTATAISSCLQAIARREK
jgi:CheY-like chemotaxis protein